MNNEFTTESAKPNLLEDEKEQLVKNLEQRTVPSLADVQSFCAEFHIKVENAAGIRPWLQFSDTHFPGKRSIESIFTLPIHSLIVEKVLKQLEEHEFDIPTPIQSIAWPILSQNRDLTAITNSGSGKTLAVS